MFANLTERLSSITRNLQGKGRLSDNNIKDTLREIRLALLEADVALSVVKNFIEGIREEAIGSKIEKSLTPGQALTKIIHRKLIDLFGNKTIELNLKRPSPLVIMMVGLQGSGKTTTAAKLAKRLIDIEKKRVMLVSVDVHRPAAILQLNRLANEIGADFFNSEDTQNPKSIVSSALKQSQRSQSDIIIIDTAGRMHVDDSMMAEVSEVYKAASPSETFFVIDSMAGQDAINSAQAFSERLDITGIILTKTDGDARGGAALSVSQVTGKSIFYLGVGEKIDDIELFHPERMASRILGMGDVLSLVEEIEAKVDRKQSERLANKLKKGKKFDLYDLKDQLEQMIGMGGMSAILDKLPNAGQLNNAAVSKQFDEKQLKRQIGIINSMTPNERHFPKTINGSRKRRIAAGSGLQIQDINKLMKQHVQMERMMKKMSGGKMKKMMRGLSGMNLPPGLR
ncbi:signal recognition particle protein [Woeseiaceae bacterium]|nr:signal recognition particle protein [Woeseiaceae bacterium]